MSPEFNRSVESGTFTAPYQEALDALQATGLPTEVHHRDLAKELGDLYGTGHFKDLAEVAEFVARARQPEPMSEAEYALAYDNPGEAARKLVEDGRFDDIDNARLHVTRELLRLRTDEQ